MINSFTKFNESLTSDIDKLKSDIDDVFAYISDDNKVSTYIRENEVYVDILSILPNNVIYDNIEEYINKHEIWHEVLLDINVAIQQLTSKGNVGVVLNINTVGNVKIKFHIIHNKIIKSDNTLIVISAVNLTKALKEAELEAPNWREVAFGTDNYSTRERDRYSIQLYFKYMENGNRLQYFQRVKEIEDKITKIFVNEGLSYFQVKSELIHTNIVATINFSEPKININGSPSRVFKRIKLKRQI
jgi:hypothetical protein